MSETDINAAEAGRRLGISRQWAVQLAREGAFEGAWLDEYSGVWHIPEEEVEAQRRIRERGESDETARSRGDSAAQ